MPKWISKNQLHERIFNLADEYPQLEYYIFLRI